VKNVFVPNAFSPNNDGKNDLFKATLGIDATGIDMVIFDRWGAEVFHATKMNAGWDGTYENGKKAEMGTYQYVIKVRFRDQKVETYTGDVTLMRKVVQIINIIIKAVVSKTTAFLFLFWTT
jgi:gliding motility-associated-like protein